MKLPYRNKFVLVICFLVILSMNSVSIDVATNDSVYIYERPNWPYMGLDPATCYESFGLGIIGLVYEALVGYKDQSPNELEGKLSTSWTISSDGLSYEFVLRQGVMFHDGVTEFNAWIMKYSIDRLILMMDLEGPVWMLTQTIKGAWTYAQYTERTVSEALDYLAANGIEVVDDYILKINLQKPYIPFLKCITYSPAVYPKAIIDNKPLSYTYFPNNPESDMVPLDLWFPSETYPDFNPTKLGLEITHNLKDSGVVPDSGYHSDYPHSWMVENAMGTGPYKLQGPITYPSINLVKNFCWWGSFAEPGVDTIIINSVDDESERIAHLKNPQEEVDEVFIRNSEYFFNFLDDDGFAIPGFNVYLSPSYSILMLQFKMADNLPFGIEEADDSNFNSDNWPRFSWGTDKASEGNPFTALAFRKAFVKSFDYQAFIDQTYNEFSEQMEGAIPYGMFGHHNTLIEDGYLSTFNPEEALYLFQQIGWKGTITLYYYGTGLFGPTRKTAAELLQTTINSMDVGITVEVVETEDWVIYSNSPLPLCGWAPDFNDPDDYIYPFFHSEGPFNQNNPFFEYINPNLDNLIEAAAIEKDIDAREQLYHEIEEITALDSPYLYLVQVTKITIIRDCIQNYIESGSLSPMSIVINAEKIIKSEPPIRQLLNIDNIPGNDKNKIKLKSNNKISVAILSTTEFDATMINPETVWLGIYRGYKNAQPISWKIKDINNDGNSDILLDFTILSLIEFLNPSSTTIKLWGFTYDGKACYGYDSINIII